MGVMCSDSVNVSDDSESIIILILFYRANAF